MEEDNSSKNTEHAHVDYDWYRVPGSGVLAKIKHRNHEEVF